MKKELWILFMVIVGLVAFFIGYSLNQQTIFSSCSSAYEDLKQNDLCKGKFEDYVGTDEVIGNIEWFDYNWQEDIGGYGHLKEDIDGPNEQCYWQGYRQFIETGVHESLVDCFANIVEVVDGELNIQCGCFFE